MGGVKVTTKQALILDVVWGIVKAHGAGVELTVNSDVFQVVAMETCFVIIRMIRREGCASEVTCPMSFTSFYSL